MYKENSTFLKVPRRILSLKPQIPKEVLHARSNTFMLDDVCVCFVVESDPHENCTRVVQTTRHGKDTNVLSQSIENRVDTWVAISKRVSYMHRVCT